MAVPTKYFSTTILPDLKASASLGTQSQQWSDLFLAQGGVINWNNGDVTIVSSGERQLASSAESDGNSLSEIHEAQEFIDKCNQSS